MLEQFSKRTVQVDAAFQAALAEFWTREGRDPTPKERGALGRQAAADTRGHKSGHGVGDLRAQLARAKPPRSVSRPTRCEPTSAAAAR